MTQAFEVNFDGMIGPSHLVPSLSGDVASGNPRAAALQGIQKMRTLLNLGYPQGFFPPQFRPEFSFLRQLGFEGDDGAVLQQVADQTPQLLEHAYSSSSFLASNAATVTPSLDSRDDKVHFTPANLISSLPRALECHQTSDALKFIFSGSNFVVHSAVTAHGDFADEGAANHYRIVSRYGGSGISLFVYTDGDDFSPTPEVKQASQASRAIARQHGLRNNGVYIQQNASAIAAGISHSDMVAVSNGPVLLHHELAFEVGSQAFAFDHIKQAEPAFMPICVPSSAVSLNDAIDSGLFNSQLLSSPRGDMQEMILVAPFECAELASVRGYLEALSRDEGQPIRDVVFVDLGQIKSTRSGPASMRLNVVLTEQELAAVDARFLATDAKLDDLEAWVKRFYREEITALDFAQSEFRQECIRTLQALEVVLEIEGFYSFSN